MKKYIQLLFLFFIIFSSNISNASHLIVGEVSYKNLGGNNYEFTFYYYRDCRPLSAGGGNPAALMDDDPLYVTIFNGNTFFSVDSIWAIEQVILPSSNSNHCLAESFHSCVNRLKFVFTKILPSSPNKYTILNQRCCMSGVISNILNPENIGYSFYCEIPPTSTAINSSSIFKPISDLFLCVNKKYVIDHSAIDLDGDSLSYEFCPIELGGAPGSSGLGPKPLITSGPIPTFQHPTYMSPFSAAHPMPGTFINPLTGELTINCNLQGSYLVGICCHEWRGGVKINTIKRTYTYTIQNCNLSTAAQIDCDSNIINSSIANTCLANCTNNTIHFKNKSIAAVKYHWDFGVASVLDDTSNIAEPIFTYPDTGRYKVTLIAIGATCTDSVSEYVNISRDEIGASFTLDGLFCIGDSISFTGTGTSSSDIINGYLWDYNFNGNHMYSNNQNPLISFQQAGPYNIIFNAFNSKGCYASDDQTITLTSLNVRAYGDTIVPLSTSIYLDASGANAYKWDYFDKHNPTLLHYSDIQQPHIQFSTPETYYFVVTGSNPDGCIGKDTAIVVYANDGKIFAPNAFSPNGDNLNDVFRIYLDGFYFKQLKIYNRRGQQVFESKDINKGWDGRFKGSEAAAETYYWFVELQTSEKQSFVEKGDLILIR